jgi:hypothetical protein
MDRLMHEPAAFPEGECYEAAFRTLEAEGLDRANNKLKPTEWILIHGIAHDARGPFGHAWLEKGETVYDPIKRLYANKADYYRINGVTLAIPYTFPQALKNFLDLNTPGYWDQRIAQSGHLPRSPSASEEPRN